MGPQTSLAPSISRAAAVSNETDLARVTLRRVGVRLFPLLFALFVCNYVDRFNVAMAALQMNRDLRFSDSVYSLGVSLFFVGYILFEVPSNLILARVGTRRWIARIMISWGIIASAMMFVRTPMQFYALRVLLGVAEAGFLPGILYYLRQWFPAAHRARAIARFLIAMPLAGTIGNPLSGLLLGIDGRLGLRGWQWLFLVEGIPSVVLGIIVLAFLPDRPDQARWLSTEQRAWLAGRIARDDDESSAPHGLSALQALAHPTMWMVAIPFVLATTTVSSFMSYAPTVIRDSLNVSSAATGYITGACACVSAAAMLAVGASLDRNGERCLHASAAALLVGFGYTGAAVLHSPVARVAGLLLVNVGVMSVSLSFWSVSTSLLSGTAAAGGIALVNSLGNVGSVLGPSLVGRIKDATGDTRDAFLLLAAFALIEAALFVAFRGQRVFASADGRRVTDAPPLAPQFTSSPARAAQPEPAPASHPTRPAPEA